ncbi:MAG: VPLPA-CTERM sorting domain-containing protein [Sulfitobacter sp.]
MKPKELVRLTFLKTKSAFAVSLFAMMAANSSLAATYNYYGKTYEVTTFTASPADLVARLLENPSEFSDNGSGVARLVGCDLGCSNGYAKVLFPFAAIGSGIWSGDDVLSWSYTGFDPVTGTGGYVVDVGSLGYSVTPRVWARATEVPLPAGVLLLLSSLAGIVALGRRKKRIA